MSEEIKSPVCPMCEQPSGLIMSIEQAFCESDGCPVFCWDMRVTPEEFRREAVAVDLDLKLL
jgi:hypothetical protein